MKKILGSILIIITASISSYAQQNYQFTLYATNTAGKTDSVIVGVDSLATDGIDASFRESLLHKNDIADSTLALFVLGNAVPTTQWANFIKPDSVTKKQIVSTNLKRAYVYIMSKDTFITISWKGNALNTVYKNTMLRWESSVGCYNGWDFGDQPILLGNGGTQNIEMQQSLNYHPWKRVVDSTLFKVPYYTGIVFINFNENSPCAVGINENRDNLINVYPNPTNSSLFITTTNENYNYTLFPINGKLALMGNTNGNSTSIDVKELVQGQYYIKLTNSSHTFIKKIIIQ